MLGQSSNRRPNPSRKTVLLIDRCEATREVRAAVLRTDGIEVQAAADLRGARFLWKPNAYSWIFPDVRRHLPGEALEFYEQIKEASARERFAFLVGPPVYVSRTWPEEVKATDDKSQQWGETVRFLAAA